MDSSLVGDWVALAVPLPEVPIDGVLVGEFWSPGLVCDSEGDSDSLGDWLGEDEPLGLGEADSLDDCEGDSLDDWEGDSLELPDGDPDWGLL